MIRKQLYETPEMEVVKLSTRSGVLTTFSGDGQGTATGDGMYREDEQDF